MKLILAVFILSAVTTLTFAALPENLADGRYYIQSIKNSYYWDICTTEGCPENFENLFAHNTLFGDESQMFDVKVIPQNGFYTITSVESGLAVTIKDTRNLAKSVYLSPPVSDDVNQHYEIVPSSSGTSFQILTRAIWKASMRSPNKINGDIFVGQSECAVTRFRFIPVDSVQTITLERPN